MVSLIAIARLSNQMYKYVSIINTCTAVIGLVGNISACIVILSSKSFYTLTGFYLLSLSTADLLILMAGISYNVLSYKFAFHDSLAVLYINEWVCQTSIMVSTLTITAFTVERYLAICHPLYVQSIPKKSRVKKIIIAIWSTSALLTLLPIAQMFIEFQMKNNHLTQVNENALQYIVVIWATLCFFMPMSVITVMYLLIWLRLKKSSKESQVVDRADTRTLTMFVAIIVAFCLSWGSYHIYRIASIYIMLAAKTHLQEKDLKILFFKLYLVKLLQEVIYPISSALNPIIYLAMSKKFREALQVLFSKSSRKLVEWSSRSFGSRIRSNTSIVTS